MTDRPDGQDQAEASAAGRARGILTGAMARAWWVVLWERLWPRLAIVITVIGLFLALSWGGLWYALPTLGRIAGVLVLGILLILAAIPIARLRPPTRTESLSRLDRASGLQHRPATTITDTLSVGSVDASSQALWQAHVDRAAQRARAIRAGTPRPKLAQRDPYALRALVVVLLFATFFAAGGEHLKRIGSAFDWRGIATPANYRVDAWVTPPAYTMRAPVLLPGIRPGETVREAQNVSVPAGSVLVIRASGAPIDVTNNGLVEGGPEQGGRAPVGTQEQRYTINESGSVTLRGPVRDVVWSFTAVPDRAPLITLTKEPEPQARGSLLLTYKLEDDYGVAKADALLAPKRAASPNTAAARPLYDAPNFPLVLPQARTRNGIGQTTKDLTEHPFAGTDMELTLVARDEANNEGRSEPQNFKLPQRPFYKPLARALIEQRRDLALDANLKPRVLKALEALTIAPERFTPEPAVFLGLRTIFWQLTHAKSDDDLREVVNRLWAMAVMLEDGNVSDAEQALRAAQDALRQALERGATDEELKKLMEDLRAAMDKFMQALAEEMRKNPQQLARPLDRNTREIRPQDLRSMLDKLENLARSGNKDAARQLLEQLQQMLENLQMARPQQGGEDGDDMMSALDELGDMIRKEQQLRDKTFRQGQDSRRERQRGQRGQRGQQGQQGQQGEQGEQGESLQDLQKNQQALREQLRKLLEDLRKRGQLGQQGKQPGQQGGEQGDDGSDALGQAEQAMRDAEGQLGDGDADGAADSQGRAIESMRKGAQGMAQNMQPGQNGPGPNGQPGRQGQARAQQETDPLGRPLRGREYGDDQTVKVPGEIDVQRARRILEELRRRFSDPLRPQIELDYLERLLKDF